jgi:hypothetical protein
MPACKLRLPPAALPCLGVKLLERAVKATCQNVSDGCDVVAGAADPCRRFKTGQRVHRALPIHPVGICRIDREERRRARRDLPAIAVGHSQFPVALAVIWQVVEKGFAVVGNEGVEIDQRANPVRHPVGDVAHDDTAVGVSDQDDVAQVLPDREIGDIRDMGAEVDVAAQEMGARDVLPKINSNGRRVRCALVCGRLAEFVLAQLSGAHDARRRATS